MRFLLFKATILSCLLLIIAGCPATQLFSRSSYGFDNLTMTCAHKALEELDGINKVWIYYDSLPLSPGFSRSHLSRKDGIGFEVEGFFGRLSIDRTAPPFERDFADVVVYAEELYWGFGDRSLVMQQVEEVKEKIKGALFAGCNE